LEELDDLKPQATGPLVEAMLAVLNTMGRSRWRRRSSCAWCARRCIAAAGVLGGDAS